MRRDMAVNQICETILDIRLKQMRKYRNQLESMTDDDLIQEYQKYVKT